MNANIPAATTYIRARKKYREKQEYLQARVTPDEKEAVTAHAAAMGESLNVFMRRAFTETMERDKVSQNPGSK